RPYRRRSVHAQPSHSARPHDLTSTFPSAIAATLPCRPLPSSATPAGSASLPHAAGRRLPSPRRRPPPPFPTPPDAASLPNAALRRLRPQRRPPPPASPAPPSAPPASPVPPSAASLPVSCHRVSFGRCRLLPPQADCSLHSNNYVGVHRSVFVLRSVAQRQNCYCTVHVLLL
uniref:Uncharacterized protein n=2 Tax=Aegilops tauschii subsp. strangulata TaxID=200361 RepID=A0A453RT49_AEGTS